MTGAPAALAVRATPFTSLEVRPKGLGGASLPTSGYGYGLVGGAHAISGPRLRRQWTMAKNTRDTSCNVLPFLLDISIALYDTLDLMKASVDSEVVFQATLQVPAHHALACRVQAYGTPFAAPDLQAPVHQLADEDLEFAACIAAPPDIDEQMSMNLGRMLSLLEQNRAQQAGPVGRTTAVTQTQQQAQPGSGAPSAVQQLRASGAQTQQQAPKVTSTLLSVDDAEAGTAQLHRSNSARKQPKILSTDLGKRAMQALLGFGYLLTVLHEKHFGGHIDFTASAITAANSITPSMGDSHVRHQNRSLRGGAGGVLAGLKQMVQECPSLTPGSFKRFNLDSSSTAAGQMQPAGSPLAPVSSGRVNGPSFEAVWNRISSPGESAAVASSGAKRPVHGLALQLSLSAPLGTMQSSNWARAIEEGMMRGGNGTAADGMTASAAQDDTATLSKAPDTGRSISMQQLLDDALQQLAAPQLAAAIAQGSSERPADVDASCSPKSDASAKTVSTESTAEAAAKLLQQKGSPYMSPFQMLQLKLQQQADAVRRPGSPLQRTSSNANTPPDTDANNNNYDTAATPLAPQQQHSGTSSPLPPKSPTFLRPMLSMRLTCSPKWQYNDSLLDVSNKAAVAPANSGQDAQQAAQQQTPIRQQRHGAVNVHGGDENAVPSGLWPTMSFSLRPVKLQPGSSHQKQQQQQAYAAAGLA